ncbi:TIGR02757 family protein [Muriicola sp.]|uniref:TIGR02757 family protein n=1 Tax=Muriicola sp. TaxID=2020856 RepID=UPI0035655CEA
MKKKQQDIRELREFLDLKVEQYNRPEFLASDPIQIPHRFREKEDIEISGFLTATIAWGNRKSIISNASLLMDLLDQAPYQFIIQHQESDLNGLDDFVHRTFNGTDLRYFIRALQNIYTHHGGMEAVFTQHSGEQSLQQAISAFRTIFFTLDHEKRTEKHVSDPSRGSAAKRINMFLRWMVRDARTGVDFGLWKSLKPSQLSCPLDVHSGKVARKLGLLTRKQNDARAVQELDENLRRLDPLDPVKYDFALFGLGVFEKF